MARTAKKENSEELLIAALAIGGINLKEEQAIFLARVIELLRDKNDVTLLDVIKLKNEIGSSTAKIKIKEDKEEVKMWGNLTESHLSKRLPSLKRELTLNGNDSNI